MTHYDGPERRSEAPKMRESLRANPAMALLLVFLVVISGLVMMSLIAERHFEISYKRDIEQRNQQTGRVLLHFCEQIEAHRAVSHAYFEHSAAHNGIPPSALIEPPDLRAPDSADEARDRCAQFRPRQSEPTPAKRTSPLVPIVGIAGAGVIALLAMFAVRGSGGD